MDKQLTKGFVDAVKKQCELYVRLKQVCVSEQKMLMSKDARGLDDAAKKQEDILMEIHKCEIDKKEFFGKLAVNEGLKYTPELKLQDVLSKAGDGDALEIERETTKLILLMKESSVLNATNARLMKVFLDFTEFTTGLKARLENPVQPMYSSGGIINNAQLKKPQFDQKI
jgi:hypothetical protein